MRRGLTLPELMVSLSLVALLTLVLTMLFHQTSRVAAMGGNRLDVQQSVRETVRRLGPLLESAVPPEPGEVAIRFPDEGDTALKVEFYSPTDLLGDQPVDLHNPTYRLYRIEFSAPSLWLEQLDPPPTREPRMLAAHLRKVEFTLLDPGTLKVFVEARARGRDVRNQERTFDERLETAIHLPYFATQ